MIVSHRKWNIHVYLDSSMTGAVLIRKKCPHTISKAVLYRGYTACRSMTKYILNMGDLINFLFA